MADALLAALLARFATDAMEQPLPPDVGHSVRQRVLDLLGICVAAHQLPTSAAVVDFVLDQGGRPQAHGIGVSEQLPAAQAAFVNGVLAHSLDYDDTHLPSVLHPSATVVPAALAAAQATGAGGSELTRAIAVGLEVAVRIGMAGYDHELRNSVFFEHGQHATSICGAMGGAVAAACLFGLNDTGVADTLGVAGSMAAGIIEANRSGGTVKRIHCGWAAHSAVTAAQLAARGITGPPTVLEGRFGFFEAFLRGQVDLAAITDGLGQDWSVPQIFFKPYPANHFTHAVIDAGLAFRARGLDPERIVRIELRLPTAAIRTIGDPIDVKRAPKTGYQAQFSGPYAVVAGLLGGQGLGVGLSDFSDELATAPRRQKLMALVDVVADERCDEIFPFQFPAIVTVELEDGTRSTEEVLQNRGGPQRPLSDDELAVKFYDNVTGWLEETRAREIVAHVLDLESVDDLDAVMLSFVSLSRPTDVAVDAQPGD